MKKLYIVTMKWNLSDKVPCIKMLRSFFPSLGLAEGKNAAEKLTGDYFGQDVEKCVHIAVTAEEYANFWVAAVPNKFGKNRVMDIQPLVMPTFYRPAEV